MRDWLYCREGNGHGSAPCNCIRDIQLLPIRIRISVCFCLRIVIVMLIFHVAFPHQRKSVSSSASTLKTQKHNKEETSAYLSKVFNKCINSCIFFVFGALEWITVTSLRGISPDPTWIWKAKRLLRPFHKIFALYKIKSYTGYCLLFQEASIFF